MQHSHQDSNLWISSPWVPDPWDFVSLGPVFIMSKAFATVFSTLALRVAVPGHHICCLHHTTQVVSMQKLQVTEKVF